MGLPFQVGGGAVGCAYQGVWVARQRSHAELMRQACKTLPAQMAKIVPPAQLPTVVVSPGSSAKEKAPAPMTV